jgi:hypothetical protein
MGGGTVVRLYKAWSVVDNFMGQDQVRLDWFVVGRTVPLAPYAELIQDYDEDIEDSCFDQVLVNELFTESEGEELRTYLDRSHQLDLQLEEVAVPVKPGGLSYGLLLISGEKSFYTLADEEGYNLRLSILGHYDVKGIAASVSLSDKDISMGTVYLQKVFRHLNLVGVDRNELVSLLQEIYAESGLHVVKGKQ